MKATHVYISAVSAVLAIGLFYLIVMFATDYRLNYIWSPLLFKTKTVLILNDEAKADKSVPNLTSLYSGPGVASSAIENANIQNIMYTYQFTVYYRGTSGPVKAMYDNLSNDLPLITSLMKNYGLKTY